MDKNYGQTLLKVSLETTKNQTLEFTSDSFTIWYEEDCEEKFAINFTNVKRNSTVMVPLSLLRNLTITPIAKEDK